VHQDINLWLIKAGAIDFYPSGLGAVSLWFYQFSPSTLDTQGPRMPTLKPALLYQLTISICLEQKEFNQLIGTRITDEKFPLCSFPLKEKTT
jgi:hypothetical protein